MSLFFKKSHMNQCGCELCFNIQEDVIVLCKTENIKKMHMMYWIETENVDVLDDMRIIS